MPSPTLIDGKIVPPSSPTAAHLRHQQVEHEIGKLERDLANPDYFKKFRTVTEYLAWKDRAVGRLGWFKEEAKQLAAWMRTHGVVPLGPREPKKVEDYDAFRRE